MKNAAPASVEHTFHYWHCTPNLGQASKQIQFKIRHREHTINKILWGPFFFSFFVFNFSCSYSIFHAVLTLTIMELFWKCCISPKLKFQTHPSICPFLHIFAIFRPKCLFFWPSFNSESPSLLERVEDRKTLNFLTMGSKSSQNWSFLYN